MDFLMPKLSDTMEEGTVLQWLVPDGAEVAKGQAVVEIETDKANMMVEAPAAGALRIAAQVGDSLPIGATIATIGDAGTASPAGPPPPAEASAVAPSPGAAPEETSTGIPTADDGTGASIGLEVGRPEDYPGAADPVSNATPQRITEPPLTTSAPPLSDDPEGIRASPLARRLAEERGIDLATIRGTGPAGRIVRDDVEAAIAGSPAPATQPTSDATPAAPPDPATPPAQAASAPSVSSQPGARVPLSRLQRTIARRMAESKPGAPHFYLQRDIDVSALLVVRRELVAASPEGEGPSVTDLLIRAVAMASAERPDAVSRFDEDSLVAPTGSHVGVAVAVPGGLLVPVVRDAATKRVSQIAAETRDLVRRCRDGTITPAELEGSVITISNLGMFGVDRFFAVINPPESAILAVGTATPTPVVRDGEVVVRDMLTLSLSVDHRALYGAEAATFLGRIADLLEHPGSLVL